MPRLGMSLAMVELVLVRWGFSGFSVCALRYCSAVSLARWFVSLKREEEVVKGRKLRAARRLERRAMRGADMVGIVVLWGDDNARRRVFCAERRR